MKYRHHSWLVSPYSAKTRACFAYKQVEFLDAPPTALKLFGAIKKAVGKPVMPTVQTPAGAWLQDSSDIIDHLESAFPERRVIPAGPTQRLAALLLEMHGDEWLTMPSMHYRWNRPANAAFAIGEFARNGLPWLPGFIGRRLIKPMAGKMAGYRPILGIKPETVPGIEAFTEGLIAQLEVHLKAHPFLFGTRPSVGDFALYGPLWAHLWRDPASRELYAQAPHVEAWFERLAKPTGEAGEFLPDDEVPETLDPIFATLFAEQMAWVRDLVAAIDRYCEGHPEATRVPRSLGDHAFVIGGRQGTRRLITFSQWMAQRPLDAYREAEGAAEGWLARIGHPDGMRFEIANRFERRDFEMRLAK